MPKVIRTACGVHILAALSEAEQNSVSVCLNSLLNAELTKQEGRTPKAELVVVKWGLSLPSEQCSNWHFHFNQVGTTKSQQGWTCRPAFNRILCQLATSPDALYGEFNAQCRTALLWTLSITSYPALNTIISILKSWSQPLIACASPNKFWQKSNEIKEKNQNKLKKRAHIQVWIFLQRTYIL